MRIRGLPSELHPGPVELEVIGAGCPLLQPCIFCKSYNTVYFLCQQSHITCSECFLPDTFSEESTLPEFEGYCKPCGSRVILYRFEIPTPLLQNLRFVCGCNYTGRLGDIRRHVKSKRFTMRCGQFIPKIACTSDEFDVELAKLQAELNETLADFQAQLPCIKQRFRDSFGDAMEKSARNKTVYSQKIMYETTYRLGLLNCRLKELESDALQLRRRSVKITPLVQDKFGKIFASLRNQSVEEGLSAPRESS